jgi:transcriptional regulator GlxA family with amidase domain
MAFRRHLDTTPMAYLRRVRLQHAHQQLQHADGQDGQTVTRVALDWGFASASRFAAYYRAAYGRAPSETLTS